MATSDMLLQLAGVVGESSDVKNKEFIDVASRSWGTVSPTDVSTGHVTGRRRSRTSRSSSARIAVHPCSSSS